MKNDNLDTYEIYKPFMIQLIAQRNSLEDENLKGKAFFQSIINQLYKSHPLFHKRLKEAFLDDSSKSLKRLLEVQTKTDEAKKLLVSWENKKKEADSKVSELSMILDKYLEETAEILKAQKSFL